MSFFSMGKRSESAPKPQSTYETFEGDPWRDPNARKFLDMTRSERRKEYKNKQFRVLEDVPCWEVYDKVRKDNKRGKDQKASQNVKKFEVNLDIAKKVSIWQGDITSLEIDAIVNAANGSLLGGGGVDGCIHRQAGKTLLEECRYLGGCETGGAKLTGGHRLPARYIIHTVGPIGKNAKALSSCYENCLQFVREYNLKTVAFCCISTGIYGYPNEDAAHVALSTARKWLERYHDEVERIIFCTFLDNDFEIYERLMRGVYFPCKKANEDTEIVKDKGNGKRVNVKEEKRNKEGKNPKAKAKVEVKKPATPSESVSDTDKSEQKNDLSKSKDDHSETKVVENPEKVSEKETPSESVQPNAKGLDKMGTVESNSNENKSENPVSKIDNPETAASIRPGNPTNPASETDESETAASGTGDSSSVNPTPLSEQMDVDTCVKDTEISTNAKVVDLKDSDVSGGNSESTTEVVKNDDKEMNVDE